MAHTRQSRPDSSLGFLGRMGSARADDAKGTPTQSNISPSIPVYEERVHETFRGVLSGGAGVRGVDGRDGDGGQQT